MSNPTQLIVVGAGEMGQRWMTTIAAASDAELSGVVDLNLELAEHALRQTALPQVPVGRDVVELAKQTGAEAIRLYRELPNRL